MKRKSTNFDNGMRAGYILILLASMVLTTHAKPPNKHKTVPRPEDSMKPFAGLHNKGVDTTTLYGKIMCGYQGWFTVDGDGANLGWTHFGSGQTFAPGRCTIDLWPDMTEMQTDEKYPTRFRHSDGSTAHVFSSYNKKTVMRHFWWMQTYGIAGVFLQRFAAGLRQPGSRYDYRNVVTANVQAGANRFGRTWAMMYDLSGLKAGEIQSVLIADWKRLNDNMRIREDKSYLHHRGKPVIAIWGIGFKDEKRLGYSLDECDALIKFMKNDPEYGNNTVFLGVPTHWRTLKKDSLKDRQLHDIIRQADVISPWTVGRYRTPEDASDYAENVIKPDIKWATQNKLDFMPVAFPGFSWHNLKKTFGQDSKLGVIPRLKGQFYWSQISGFKKAGAKMLYIAMFDEVDEGTAIFKCTNDPPVGQSKFLTYEGLLSDHYLWLTWKAGCIYRDEAQSTDDAPLRNKKR